MKINLIEMEGLLRGKCLPGNMMVNESLAEYLVRQFDKLNEQLSESRREFTAANATIHNLELKVAQVVAENAGLKDSVEHAAGCIHAAEVEGLIDALGEKDGERLADLIHRRLCHAYLPVETPATDAYQAEVRAQGVDMYAERKNNEMMSLHPDTHAVGSIAAAMSAEVKELREFAAQLRQGAEHE